jgi:hypothetical protein
MYGLGACNPVTNADGTMKVVCDTPTNIDTVLPSGTNVIQDSSGQVVYTSGSTLGGISTTTLLIAGAAAAFLLLLAKAGR